MPIFTRTPTKQLMHCKSGYRLDAMSKDQLIEAVKQMQAVIEHDDKTIREISDQSRELSRELQEMRCQKSKEESRHWRFIATVGSYFNMPPKGSDDNDPSTAWQEYANQLSANLNTTKA